MVDYQFNEAMKKKLIISNYDDCQNPYYAGGGARAVAETAKALSSSYEVTVITGAYKGARSHEVSGVYYKRIGIRFGGPKLGQLVYQCLLPYYVLTQRYDVWLESFTPPFSTGLLQLFTKRPVIGLVHMLAGDDMRRKYKLPFDLIERLGLTTYRYFITTNQKSQDVIRQANKGASIVVIPNGVHPMRLSRKIKKDYFLYLRRIEVDQKGIDLMLQAYKDIAAKTSYPLVIAGGGEKKQLKLLTQMITDLKLTDRVRCVGKVEGKRKEILLSKAVCLVVPSRFETFSLSALEAVMAGIPVVAFQIPGLSWLPERVTMRVPAYSTSRLGNAMQQATKPKKVLPRLSDHFIREHSWQHIGAQYQRYVTAVLSQ
jgi:phosphatidyl-myo-inositol alpha-mannosyltransferase